MLLLFLVLRFVLWYVVLGLFTTSSNQGRKLPWLMSLGESLHLLEPRRVPDDFSKGSRIEVRNKPNPRSYKCKEEIKICHKSATLYVY